MDFERPYISSYESEADTCRKEVLPKLRAVGWTDDLILEQRYFTAGKIIVVGRKAKRKEAKRFDYLLRYTQNFPIAIVEAKNKYKNATDGLQQAKEYAEMLKIKFAYATNGDEIVEFDFTTGKEQMMTAFPSPDELWSRLNTVKPIKKEIKDIFLKPFYAIPEKPMRYYQQIAVNEALKAILEGKPRILLTLATGTGKTTIAFQIIYKLWNNRWNRTGEHRRPKILFLADRSVLVTDPHAKDFSVFGAARCLIPEEGFSTAREIYFSTYQSLAEDSNRRGAFRDVARDFFDMIVVPPANKKKYSKTRPIQIEEFAPVKEWWTNRTENENAWKVAVKDVFKEDISSNTLTINLDQKNPNRKSEFDYREPAELVASIVEKEKLIMQLMDEIKKSISHG